MHVSTFSIPGLREHNEDTIYPSPNQPGGNLFIVADGLGGHTDGKIASQLAVEAVSKLVINENPADFVLGGHRMNESELMEAFLSDVVRQAGATVRHEAKQRGSDMGTTLLVVLIKNGQGYCAHIGDCALFVSETGQMPLVKMTVEHRRGPSLTRSLGTQEQVTPDVFSFVFDEHSILVMGCDGFWEHITPDVIGRYILETTPAKIAEELTQAALKADSQDNISVIVVEGDAFIEEYLKDARVSPSPLEVNPPLETSQIIAEYEQRITILEKECAELQQTIQEVNTLILEKGERIKSLETQLHEQSLIKSELEKDLIGYKSKTSGDVQTLLKEQEKGQVQTQQLVKLEQQIQVLKTQDDQQREYIKQLKTTLQKQEQQIMVLEEISKTTPIASHERGQSVIQEKVAEIDGTLQAQIRIVKERIKVNPKDASNTNRYIALDFARRLLMLYEKYPAECSEVLTEAWFNHLQEWLPTQEIPQKPITGQEFDPKGSS